MEATFRPVIDRIPQSEHYLYKMEDLHLHFSGIRRMHEGLGRWIGEEFLTEFGDHIRSVTNSFYAANPAILRTSTGPIEDMASKILYVADEGTYQHIVSEQLKEYVTKGDDKETLHAALIQKIAVMKSKTVPQAHIFDDVSAPGKFGHLVAMLQNRLGTAFQGTTFYHSINFTHSPVSRHLDRCGFAGSNDFTGAGAAICNLRLQGEPVFIVIQEVSTRCQNRYPLTVFFTVASHDSWDISGPSRFLTDHGVYPSQVPSMGASDPQPHSTLCCGKVGCNMSITFRFGDVPSNEWRTWMAMRREKL